MNHKRPFRCVAKCMQLNALCSVIHNTSVNRDVIQGCQGVDKSTPLPFFKRKFITPSQFQQRQYLHKYLCLRYNWSKETQGVKDSCNSRKDHFFLVNEVSLCCSILKRKESNLGFKIMPSNLVQSDYKKEYSCRFEVISAGGVCLNSGMGTLIPRSRFSDILPRTLKSPTPLSLTTLNHRQAASTVYA
ncbi:hypothetical protein TNCV_38601 [Trichonephila clavipes]|nr:hypothetical protein TNCV_38601 [Trichonephila clavipes]